MKPTKISTVSFTKMSGAGNDFIVVNNIKGSFDIDWPAFAIRYCAPKTGIGVDGVVVLDKDADTNFAFRIFNADGSEAEMCGNGARCAAAFAVEHGIAGQTMRIKTPAGIIEGRINGADTAIKMTAPFGLKTGITINVGSRKMTMHIINTGVPHTIILTEYIEDEPVDKLGRIVRYHDHFKPAGTNVDFVQVMPQGHIRVRTYERGVEAETYACGTGAVASAIVCTELGKISGPPVHVHMKGGVLKIDFTKRDKTYRDVWLMGPVMTIFTGEVILKP
jgi:diaminopimelate epimerase